MNEIDKNKVIHDWKELSGESIEVPVYTYLDEVIHQVNIMYNLHFSVVYFNSKRHHMIQINHTSPDFVVMVIKYSGEASEELLKDKISRDFLKYLMFGKTVKSVDQFGVYINIISVKDLIDKNY